MNTKIIIGVLAVFILGLLLLIVTQLPAPSRSSTNAAAVGFALPAQSTGSITTVAGQVACARAAIDAHDTAVENANNALFAAEQKAYITRDTALDQAYSGTTWASVVAPANAAFAAFDVAINQATSTSQSAHNIAAAQYNAAIAACKTRSGV